VHSIGRVKVDFNRNSTPVMCVNGTNIMRHFFRFLTSGNIDLQMFNLKIVTSVIPALENVHTDYVFFSAYFPFLASTTMGHTDEHRDGQARHVMWPIGRPHDEYVS